MCKTVRYQIGIFAFTEKFTSPQKRETTNKRLEFYPLPLGMSTIIRLNYCEFQRDSLLSSASHPCRRLATISSPSCEHIFYSFVFRPQSKFFRIAVVAEGRTVYRVVRPLRHGTDFFFFLIKTNFFPYFFFSSEPKLILLLNSRNRRTVVIPTLEIRMMHTEFRCELVFHTYLIRYNIERANK